MAKNKFIGFSIFLIFPSLAFGSDVDSNASTEIISNLTSKADSAYMELKTRAEADSIGENGEINESCCRLNLSSFLCVLQEKTSAICSQVAYPLAKQTIEYPEQIKTVDGRQLAYDFIPPNSENFGVVVLFNDNVKSEDWADTEVFKFLRLLGLGIFIPCSQVNVDDDKPRDFYDKDHIIHDNEAIFHLLVDEKNIDPSNIATFGHAAGSSQAAYFAHYHRTPLVLQNPRENIDEIGKQDIRIFNKLKLERFSANPISLAIIYNSRKAAAARLFQARYSYDRRAQQRLKHFLIKSNDQDPEDRKPLSLSSNAKRLLIKFLTDNGIIPRI